MSGPDLSNYVEVKDRIAEFYTKYATGSLQSEYQIVTAGAKVYVVVKAYAYRDDTDDHPGIGHSWLEVPGATPYTRGSELENAETSAWGRAIAALGFSVDKSVASANEIRNKQQTTGDTVTQMPSRQPTPVTAARSVEKGSSVPPVAATGLTQAQRGKLQTFYRAQGWGTDKAHKFQFVVTGKDTTTKMDNADFDKLLAAMDNPTYLELVQQEVAA